MKLKIKNYAVIQAQYIANGKFEEEVLFVGTQKECAKVEDEYRKTYTDTTKINCYTINIDEHHKQTAYIEALKEHEKTLTEEYKKEIVEVGGKKYYKYILDFKKEYEKRIITISQLCGLTDKEVDAARALRSYLGFEDDTDLLMEDIEYGYITTNIGRDGKTYVWYADESNNVAVEVETLTLIEDEDEICGLLA